MEIEYELRKSRRKTISLEVTRNLDIIVRAPLKADEKRINEFVLSHGKWIVEKLQKQQKLKEKYPEPSPDEIKLLKKEAKDYIVPKVQIYAEIMGLYPEGVKITSAKTRFGSCSYKNNLCFSYHLMRYPKAAVDYVIVHELAHIQEKNHSGDFYKIIESVMPDYKYRQNLLKK